MTPHTSLVGVQTDGPHRITIETGDCHDGRWFRVLNAMIDDGTAASLRGDALLVLLTHLRLRESDGRSRITIDELATRLNRHRATIFRAHDQLAAHQPILLLRHADALWEPLPGRHFAGRHSGDPPDSRSAATPPATQSRSAATAADGGLGNARASNQPERDWIQDQNQARDSARASVVGWLGLGGLWSLAGTCATPAEALARLGLVGILRDRTERLPGLTVEAIERTAIAVMHDPTIRSASAWPFILSRRLHQQAGVTPIRKEELSGRTARFNDADLRGLATLEEIRRRRKGATR